MPAIRLARRRRQVSSTRRSPSPRSPRSIGPGLAKAALAGKVDGKLVDTSLSSSTTTPTLAIVTDKDRRRPRRHPPLDRAPARLRGEGAVPRGAGDDRPGDRGRLLLRLLVQAALHARGPRGDREEDGASSRRRTSRSSAREMPRDEAVKFFEGIGEHYKAEIIASIPSRRADLALRARATSSTCAAARTCRRPASSRCSS